MQALLLLKSGTTEYVIAFRGTDSWFDIGIDTIIGLSNYNSQFEDAKTFVQSVLDNPEYNISPDNLTLTGHSLGGMLTQSVGALLGIKGYAFNPYGTERLLTMWPDYSNSLLDALVDVGIYQVLNALGLESSYADFARENILNISYNDFGVFNGDILSNFVSALSSDHLGAYLPIFGEDVGADGHKLPILNAAIQHYVELLDHFTTATTMNDLSLAYILSGKDGFDRVEQVFSDLSVVETAEKSLSLSFGATRGINGTDDAVPLAPNEIETLAREDIAYRYALTQLNPFAVNGVDYSLFNQNGELDIYNPETRRINRDTPRI